MADHTQRLAIVVTASDLASGKLGKVRSELASMGMSGKLASVGLGGAMLAVNKGEQALGNFKNRLTSLAAPLAMIGLTGGILSIGGALQQGISKANDWGLAIEKLQGLTSDSAKALSGYLALTSKFNLSTDVATQIAGFEQKAMGKLQMATASATKAGKSAALQSLETQKLKLQEVGASVKVIDKLISEQKARDTLNATTGKGMVGQTKLVALQKLYGVQLADSKGQALSFTTVLLNVADAYSKASTAAQKAKVDALAATVFGRGYAQLIPILKLGKQGILDAEAAAAQLGLTLSDKNVADLAKFREATRLAGDAVSGLELQLGLAVAPDLAEVFKSFSTGMAAHQGEIKQMFADGLHTAEALAGFITGTVVPAVQSIAGAAAGIWAGIPGPMKDLLVKGFVADRTLKFLFGMSPIHAVVSLAEGGIAKGLGALVGGIFTRGGSAANPMYVADVAGNGGPMKWAAGLLTTVATLATAIAVPAALVVLPTLDRIQNIDKTIKNPLGGQDWFWNIFGKTPTAPIVRNTTGVYGSPTDRQEAADARAAAATQKVSDHMDALTGSLDDLRKGTHALLNEQIKHQGAAFLAAGDKAGTAARDTSARKLVQLYTTSDSPSQVSMSATLRNLLREAKVHPTDKVVAAAIVTLQALVAATTAAVNALPHNVAGGTGGMVGQDQYTPVAVHVNVAPAPLHKAVIKYGRGSNVGSGVRGY